MVFSVAVADGLFSSLVPLFYARAQKEKYARQAPVWRSISEPLESGGAGPRMNRYCAACGTKREHSQHTLSQFSIAIIAYIHNDAVSR
jgi:hypothetical protein